MIADWIPHTHALPTNSTFSCKQIREPSQKNCLITTLSIPVRTVAFLVSILRTNNNSSWQGCTYTFMYLPSRMILTSLCSNLDSVKNLATSANGSAVVSLPLSSLLNIGHYRTSIYIQWCTYTVTNKVISSVTK